MQSVAFTAATGKSHLLIGVDTPPRPQGTRFAPHRRRFIEILHCGLADNTVGKIIESLLRADLLTVDEIGFATGG